MTYIINEIKQREIKLKNKINQENDWKKSKWKMKKIKERWNWKTILIL
jgi:hypothetical protein